MIKENTNAAPGHFDFLLLDGFSSLSFNAALETLQNANLVAGRELYSWNIVSVEASQVTSSTGLPQPTSRALTDLMPGTDIVLVSGEDAYNVEISQLKVWLAKHVRANVRLTALGTAAILLARTGTFKGCEVAIHPWYRTGFAEAFDDVQLSPRTHIGTGLRCSASAGAASIDLFLDFIEQDHGAELSNLVADSMCYRQARLLQASIDVGKPNSVAVLHPIVSQAVSKMENNIEFPSSPSALADELNISTRQLERLFKRYIGQSPKRHYMRIRLQEAYRLLIQTKFDITEIGLMTGFMSPSHFSKCFRAEFQTTPYELRKRPKDASTTRLAT